MLRTVGRGVKHLVYSDPKTYTGSDPGNNLIFDNVYFQLDEVSRWDSFSDPSFDDDDELVFMAKNLGERAVRGSFRLPDHFKQVNHIIEETTSSKYTLCLGQVC